MTTNDDNDLSSGSINMMRLLKAIFFTPGFEGRWGLPAVFIGAPGVAKSSRIRAACRTLGLYLETLIASIRMPEDFGGVMVPETDDGQTIITPAPMPWVPRVNGKKWAVVFFDELNTAEPAKQKPLLRIVLEGVCGDTPLDPRVRFIAAMNRVEEATDGHDISPPLANRFGWYAWDPGTLADYSEHMMGAAERDMALFRGEDARSLGEALINPEAEERRVLNAWPEAFAAAWGDMDGFLHHFPEFLHKQPPAHDPKSSGAWPSRRTNEYAVRAMAGARIHGLTTVERDAMLTAYLGAAAAAQLSTYLEELDLPDYARLLDGQETFTHDPQRLDRTYAVLSGCTALVSPQNAEQRDARGDALWKLIDRIISAKGASKDIVVPAVRKLSQVGHLKHESADPVLDKLHDVVTIAKSKAA